MELIKDGFLIGIGVVLGVAAIKALSHIVAFVVALIMVITESKKD